MFGFDVGQLLPCRQHSGTCVCTMHSRITYLFSAREADWLTFTSKNAYLEREISLLWARLNELAEKKNKKVKRV